MVDRVDKMVSSLTTRVNKDFIEKETVTKLIKDLSNNFNLMMTPKESHRTLRAENDARIKELYELYHESKKALQNHTKHITTSKNDMKDKVPMRKFQEMVTHMKKFALNEQYLTLYEKVVPPVQLMETQTDANTK